MADLIGVDLGGTNILAGVVADGRVVREDKADTPRGGPDAVADEITRLIRGLSDDVASVGIGAPGPIDAGDVVNAPNLVGWTGRVPLAGMVSQRLDGVHVGLVNDGDAAVFGEHAAGAAVGTGDVLGIWWGTGIGGGLVIDGRPRLGPAGSVGEVGHVPVDISADAPICGCGRTGCAEAFAGRMAMERLALQAVAQGRTTSLLDIRDAKGKDRFTSGVWKKALKTQDPLATDIILQAYRALGALVAGILNVVDAHCIVLGGGMGEKLGVEALEGIRAAATPRLMLPDIDRRWVLSGLVDDAGVVGAATLSSR